MSGIEDERAAALRRADAGVAAWLGVVHAQQGAASDHGDFYELAGYVVETLRALEALAGVLVGQVAGYGHGRVVRDDEGLDPGLRLALAVGHLTAARASLDGALVGAHGFWSEIGHIGVEVTG